ncbi:phosphate/phosphite/phosphonate ABC transporter substrate-binding protein [Salibacterium salarium]|uniref:Phosphate/phosphite/phosphonate ABC transporter substrate-binding protein n=1 Tax=Salibacterium salarium TaxID=284579 RepID=A0A3R9P5H0_9BACI|nr:phosphate/phosphite/phosphonate ABC transporter substrate-binding protein [Salibacterium salarium]RSL33265.1 phosphate/phosphite/phosphonate ABC transporter substrate-binding protein [Salibacterium salarium]
MKKWTIALVVSSLLILGGCGESDDEPIEVAVIPAQSSGEMDGGLSALETSLNESMEQEVAVEHYPSYNAVVEALNYGRIDLAYLGPLTYVIANEESGAEAILTQEIGGEPYYYSYIISHVDQPWDNLDEMLEQSGEVDFAFGSVSSTSGSLMPGLELRERGVFESEDEHDFASVRYTGSHDVTANAVATQDVQAGAIDSAIYDELVEDGTIDDSQIKKIWESDQLYQYPWAVPEGTDEDRKQQFQDAFTSIEDDQILEIFGGASSFVETDHSNYESIAQAAEDFGMLNMDSIEE